MTLTVWQWTTMKFQSICVQNHHKPVMIGVGTQQRMKSHCKVTSSNAWAKCSRRILVQTALTLMAARLGQTGPTLVLLNLLLVLETVLARHLASVHLKRLHLRKVLLQHMLLPKKLLMRVSLLAVAWLPMLLSRRRRPRCVSQGTQRSWLTK